LSFAPDVLKASSVSEGAFVHTGALFAGFIDNVTGEITFIANSLKGVVPGVSGTGNIAHIQLLVVGPGTSVITVDHPILLDSALFEIIPAQLQPAYVTAQSTDETPVPEPRPVTLVFIAATALSTIRLIGRATGWAVLVSRKGTRNPLH
jgi:hypothetical protein